MKSRLILIITLFLCAYAHADDVKTRINEIKRDPAYVNAEVTDENRDEAYALAVGELTREVNTLFGSSISIRKVKGVVQSLEVKRGNSFRVFVYAPKETLRAMLPGKRPTSSATVSYIPTPQEEAQPTTSQVPAQAETSAQPTAPAPAVKPSVGTVTPIFARMNTFTEIRSLLRQYKEEGKVAAYDWVKDLNVDPRAYIIIFNNESIEAILLPEADGRRLNFMTDREDKITNYEGRRAVWYKE